MPAKPSAAKAALTGPSEGCNMNCQTVAIATRVEVTGRKYTTS